MLMNVNPDVEVSVDYREAFLPTQATALVDQVMARLGSSGVGFTGSEFLMLTLDMGGNFFTFLINSRVGGSPIQRLCNCLRTGRAEVGLTHLEFKRQKPCDEPFCILAPGVMTWRTIHSRTNPEPGEIPGQTLWVSPVSPRGGRAFEDRMATLMPELDPLTYAMVAPDIMASINKVLQASFMRTSEREAWISILTRESKIILEKRP